MKRLLAPLACMLALLGALPSTAATVRTPDYSDLWWNADESGWGAHVTLQDEVVFMVLFVYDDQRQPRFLVAPDMQRGAGPADTYEGALYSTAGPPFTGAFDPAAVSQRVVGQATLRFGSSSSGELSYSVDGVTVAKSITRQAWRPLDYAGEYFGGLFATATGCFDGLPSIAYPGSVAITQSGDAITLNSRFLPGFAELGTCRMTGRLVQQGSQASIVDGTYDCEFFDEPNTASGTFEVTDLRVGPSGFSGRYLGRQGPACVHDGHLGGMRRGHVDRPPPPEPQPE